MVLLRDSNFCSTRFLKKLLLISKNHSIQDGLLLLKQAIHKTRNGELGIGKGNGNENIILAARLEEVSREKVIKNLKMETHSPFYKLSNHSLKGGESNYMNKSLSRY